MINTINTIFYTKIFKTTRYIYTKIPKIIVAYLKNLIKCLNHEIKSYLHESKLFFLMVLLIVFDYKI